MEAKRGLDLKADLLGVIMVKLNAIYVNSIGIYIFEKIESAMKNRRLLQ